MRPEASDTTGTLRDTSGVTVPVTTNSEVVGRLVAVASGNCSGCSTVNRLASGARKTLASGGAPADAASASGCACTLPQPANTSSEKMQTSRRLISELLLLMPTPQLTP